mmetsp:Transcript_48891/g.141632  ORF Transcript_48891/g.141632 Transcript_48891/m.141632 type:complete len:226 (-) Transcript_48891:329-1006(-)
MALGMRGPWRSRPGSRALAKASRLWPSTTSRARSSVPQIPRPRPVSLGHVPWRISWGLRKRGKPLARLLAQRRVQPLPPPLPRQAELSTLSAKPPSTWPTPPLGSPLSRHQAIGIQQMATKGSSMAATPVPTSVRTSMLCLMPLMRGQLSVATFTCLTSASSRARLSVSLASRRRWAPSRNTSCGRRRATSRQPGPRSHSVQIPPVPTPSTCIPAVCHGQGGVTR